MWPSVEPFQLTDDFVHLLAEFEYLLVDQVILFQPLLHSMLNAGLRIGMFGH